MPTLLHLDSSPRGEMSVSRRLTAEFVRQWRAAHPDERVVVRDLAASPPPFLDGAWIGANFTPKESRSEAQRGALAPSDALVAELRDADELIIGAPLYNFGIAAPLKAYIDQIVRAGETFRYTERGPEGLLGGKAVTFVVSAGGTYGPGSATFSMNHVEPYLRTMFGFLGITDPRFVLADGARVLNLPDADREGFFEPHLTSVRGIFAN